MDRKFRCKRPVSMYFTQLKMFRTSVAVFLYIPSSIAEKVFSFLTGIMLIVKLYKKNWISCVFSTIKLCKIFTS